MTTVFTTTGSIPVASRPTSVILHANRVGEVLRKIFALAIGWGMRTDNPASGFRRRIENERERFLTPEEIGRLPFGIGEHLL